MNAMILWNFSFNVWRGKLKALTGDRSKEAVVKTTV
jgi:hypothetical protein